VLVEEARYKVGVELDRRGERFTNGGSLDLNHARGITIRTQPRADLRPGTAARPYDPSIPFATRAFPELLIDGEEDRTLRAVLVGMLREVERQTPAGEG
jgi:hypothetical protein